MSRRLLKIMVGALLATQVAAAAAQDLSAMAKPGGCAPAEPDSIQISWQTPCTTGEWLFEPGIGCRLWDWHPMDTDTATWSGRCTGDAMNGYGVMQWFEHGRPIDRFEGSVVAGRRQGPGRYRWNETDWYVGFYENDLPHGLGTASIAGETFYGRWHRGCLTRGSRTVAIGIPRASCNDMRTS